MGSAPYVAPEMAGHFRHNVRYSSAAMSRDAINDGRADYTPIYLSEIEELFTSGAMPIDVALLELSPPDAHGFCSFGVGVDTSLTAAQCARYVVAQIKRSDASRTATGFIHVSKIDAACRIIPTPLYCESRKLPNSIPPSRGMAAGLIGWLVYRTESANS